MILTPLHGFRVVGGVTGPRRVIDWPAAFLAHCAAEPRSEPGREAYLSAFVFDLGLLTRVQPDGCTVDVRGYDGPCWSPWVWFDIDQPDPAAALADARRLVGVMLHEVCPELNEDDLLCFFSGSKGVHVGVQAAVVRPDPSPLFNRVARLFCERLAGLAGVAIDGTVYDKQRLFRAPNSRHPKTGLHKRRLTHDELMNLTADRIRGLAADPLPFDPPDATATSDSAASLWAECEAAARTRAAAQRERADSPSRRGSAGGRLQRATLDLLHLADPPQPGERERRLFRAAANLTEADCPPALVADLLDRPGRDCGLTPAELAHAIQTGIDHATCKRAGGLASDPAPHPCNSQVRPRVTNEREGG